MKTIRVSNRNYELAGAERARVAERDRHEIWCGDPDDGDVRIWILADDIGHAVAAVRKRNLHFRASLDHVAVGQNESIGGKHETRPASRRLIRSPAGPCVRSRDLDA